MLRIGPRKVWRAEISHQANTAMMVPPVTNGA
jgi:hypothetical protein